MEYMWYMRTSDELYHYGVKGQKWGVRRYQNSDGSLTPAGRRRYGVGSGQIQDVKDLVNEKSSMSLSELSDYAQTIALGKNKVDTYIKRGTTLARIQTNSEFLDLPFYATYRKYDINKYAGLFGKNLISRARREARESGNSEDAAKGMDIYQLKLKAKQSLKIPSDDNASGIMRDLLVRDRTFKQNLSESIRDSKTKMRRPTQQMLFERAERALRRDPARWTNSERQSVYEAFNLSLTNHNQYEIDSQNTFYNALRQRGYSAIIDVNDRNYSSYHASRPLIVFNTGAVSLESANTLNARDVNRLYSFYNTERLVRDTIYNALHMPADYARGRYDEMYERQER